MTLPANLAAYHQLQITSKCLQMVEEVSAFMCSAHGAALQAELDSPGPCSPTLQGARARTRIGHHKAHAYSSLGMSSALFSLPDVHYAAAVAQSAQPAASTVGRQSRQHAPAAFPRQSSVDKSSLRAVKGAAREASQYPFQRESRARTRSPVAQVRSGWASTAHRWRASEADLCTSGARHRHVL